MVKMQGVEAVKKLTDMVLNDCGSSSGMFGEEYNKAARVESDTAEADLQANLII